MTEGLYGSVSYASMLATMAELTRELAPVSATRRALEAQLREKLGRRGLRVVSFEGEGVIIAETRPGALRELEAALLRQGDGARAPSPAAGSGGEAP